MKTYIYHSLLGIVLGCSIALGMHIVAPFTSAIGGGIYYDLFPRIYQSNGTVRDSRKLDGFDAAQYQRLIQNTCVGQWANGVNA